MLVDREGKPGVSKPSLPRRAQVLAFFGFPVLLMIVIVPVIVFHNELWVLLTSVRKLETWVRASGPWAPLVFIAVQVVHVIVFIIPGEAIQIAGGYLFGTWAGALYATLGVLIGSPIDFFAARLLGVPFVNALFSAERVQRMRAPLGMPGSKAVLFLLFLIPGIPKDALCYVSGLSPLQFRFFIFASLAGRLPGIIGSSLIGSSVADRKWVLAGLIFAAATILFATGFLFRRRIEQWLLEIAERHDRSQG
jgi:uncharacterized membrane protein YdjX (TVP38/TMEM64 family)